jgi:hypothetical protein
VDVFSHGTLGEILTVPFDIERPTVTSDLCLSGLSDDFEKSGSGLDLLL